MQALPKKETQWKEDICFPVKWTWQKISQYYADMIPVSGMLLISAYIVGHFWMVRLFRKYDNRIDIQSGDETSYTTWYQVVFRNYVENE